MGQESVVLLVLTLYFIPSIVAISNKRQVAAIIALNVLLGWTLIGWIVALVWALTNKPESAIATERASRKGDGQDNGPVRQPTRRAHGVLERYKSLLQGTQLLTRAEDKARMTTTKKKEQKS
jgi:hypothetical protein